MKILRNIFIGILAFGLYSCEKDEDTLIQRGDIVGFVKLNDENGRELTDRTGVKVELENTSYSSLTDENGRYVFKNVPAGTYHLSYSLDNYGEYTIQGYQFIGGNMPALVYETKLYQQPATFPDEFSAIINGGYIEASISYSVPNAFIARFYFSNKPDVSIDNYVVKCIIEKEESTYISNYGKSGTTFSLEYTSLSKNEPIYYVAYLFNYYETYTHASYIKATEVRELLIN